MLAVLVWMFFILFCAAILYISFMEIIDGLWATFRFWLDDLFKKDD